MLEVAEIFRLHGESFRSQHELAPWHLKAMADIEHCRTAYFGGHLERCDRCGHEHYSYHSCRNRHCPKCHGEQTQAWLESSKPVCSTSLATSSESPSPIAGWKNLRMRK